MLYFKNFFLRKELSTLRIQVALRVSTGMSLAMTMRKHCLSKGRKEQDNPKQRLVQQLYL